MTASTDETLCEIRVRVPRAQFDLVTDFITERISAGIVVDDPEGADSASATFYASPELARENIALVKECLVRLFGPDEDIDAMVSSVQIKNVAWEEEYRRSIGPVVIGSDVVIRPPWVTPPIATRYDIIIEPKMAFGTGSHETTRSCLQIIRDRFRPGMRLLDLGCGSGVLSILADKLGASFVKAIDYDLLAVENCEENFALNGVTAPHEVSFGSIEKIEGDERYQFVVANIIKSTILELLPRLLAAPARPGFLVLSGLLDQDVNEVYEALAAHGATNHTTLADNEWRTITIEFS